METIHVRYSLRRTIAMRMNPDGSLLVYAPAGTSEQQIRDFVHRHRRWIARHRDRLQKQAETGSFFDGLQLDTAGKAAAAHERLSAILLPLVNHYSKLMGVAPSRITLRPSRTRWGSCNKSLRSINFSYYLLLLPHECIEEVVVHELCHLKEANHGPRFYALMDKYYPAWRTTRKITNGIVQGGSRDTAGGLNDDSLPENRTI